jgi:HD superfamily phosphohydrolase YqeK
MGINENRLKHSLGVARKAAEFGEKIMGWEPKKCQDMFVLGLLHDIGYEYTDTFFDHSFVGGEILRRAGYKYWNEVYCHGIDDCIYESEELDILNLADMHVGYDGRDVSIEERLEGVRNRYGVDSLQLRIAKNLAEELEKKILSQVTQTTSKDDVSARKFLIRGVK